MLFNSHLKNVFYQKNFVIKTDIPNVFGIILAKISKIFKKTINYKTSAGLAGIAYNWGNLDIIF